MKYIKKCIPYFMQEKKQLFILIGLSIFFALFSSLFPTVTAKVLDLVTQSKLDEALILALVVISVSIFSSWIDNIFFRRAYNIVYLTVVNNIKKML